MMKYTFSSDDSVLTPPTIEHVPHFGRDEAKFDRKRCYTLLQDILSSDELQQDVSQLSRKRRRKEATVITMPKPFVEVKTEDSGVASSVISTRGASSIQTELVDALLPDDYKENTYDFEDTYKGPFWKPPVVKYDGIYLVMVTTRLGETWVQARFIKADGPICTVRIVNTKQPAKVFWQFFALAEEVSQYLKIGQRVVAPQRRNADTGEMGVGRKTYKLGTVTEYPAIENNHRYLIFFDSGNWAYVNIEDVRPLMYQRTHAWRDVPAPHKFALRMYLKRLFPPMVPFEKGQIVIMRDEKVSKHKCECLHRNFDNMYVVLNVDCSLVALYHRIDRTTFLIHRGYPYLQKSDIQLASRM